MPRIRRESVVAYALLAPAFLLVAGLVVYPLWTVAATSLRIGRSMNIARLDQLPLGLANYARALGEEVFWDAALRTALYAASSVSTKNGKHFQIAGSSTAHGAVDASVNQAMSPPVHPARRSSAFTTP